VSTEVAELAFYIVMAAAMIFAAAAVWILLRWL
jgi:hypothetical protein